MPPLFLFSVKTAVSEEQTCALTRGAGWLCLPMGEPRAASVPSPSMLAWDPAQVRQPRGWGGFGCKNIASPSAKR